MSVQPVGELAEADSYRIFPLMLDKQVRVLAYDKELCTVIISQLQRIPVVPGRLHNCTGF